MKKKILSLILVSTLCTFTVAEGVAKTVSSEATWQATAKKDSSSELVVVATGGALQFDYAAGQKAFNTQRGGFSVDIDKEVSIAQDFKLFALIENENILKRSITADGSKSTLTVGAKWNDTELSSEKTLLLDADKDKENDLNDLKKLLGTKGDRVDTLSNFTFYIKKATDNDGAEVKESDYSTLPDGTWSGNVKVKFQATWTNS